LRYYYGCCRYCRCWYYF